MLTRYLLQPLPRGPDSRAEMQTLPIVSTRVMKIDLKLILYNSANLMTGTTRESSRLSKRTN